MCRGIVLDVNGKIVNFPFERFFNYHEPEYDGIDFSSAVVQEKLDGSLISVWHTGKEWEVTTRGSFYPNENAHNFKETFMRLFNNFGKLQPGFCYMFEMISKDNRIVTKYKDEFVVLLGRRNLETMRETGQPYLDKIAGKIDVRRPKRFKATNIIECRHLFQDMKDDEEGIVAVDKQFKRLKLKQESYLKMAKIISMKNQDVLEYVLGITDLDADFTDMPELKEKEDEIIRILGDVSDYILGVYKNIANINTQKEFASHALRYSFSSVLFGLRKGDLLGNLLTKWDRLIGYYDSMIIPSKKKLIILSGIPGSGKSTWIKEIGFEQYSLSMDTLRLMFEAPNPYISQKHNAKVYKIFMEMIESRMSNGGFTIIDAVHATEKYVNGYDDLCEKFGYEKQVITFDIPLEDALEWNKKREEYKQVPEDIIIRMHKQLETKGL